MKKTVEIGSDPNIGRFVLEKYRIESVLGDGGFGRVYVAKHIELNNKVAVKVLLPEWSRNAQVVARFVRESKLASDLSHPRIVTVLDADVFPEDGAHYLVMELLRGMSLEDKIAQFGWIHDLDEALDLFLQMADALVAAHSACDDHGQPAPIVHRDLKPDNIFVERRGNVKTLDFGIAKLTSSEDDVQLTGAGSRMGTPLYMSPEQYLDSGGVDPRSDIFSLGVILYRMLTGRLPFMGASPTAIALAHHQEPPIDPRVHRPEIFEGWARAILRAMSVRVEDRQRSVRELAAELIAGHPRGAEIARRVVPDLLDTADPEDLTVKHREETTRSTSYHTAGATVTPPVESGTRARSRLLPVLLGVGLLGIVIAMAFAVTRGGNNTNADESSEQAAPPAAAPAPGMMADAASPTVVAEPPDAAGEPARVSVRIVTEPPGAVVRVDGDDLGRAPVSFTGRAGQRIMVQAHRDHYTARPVAFELRADTPKLEIALRPIQRVDERVSRKRARRKRRPSKVSSKREPPKREAPKPAKKRRAPKAGVFR